MNLDARIQSKREGKTKRQKIQRNLGFVKSPSVQIFVQFKSRRWRHLNDGLGLERLFAYQLALNPNGCANPSSLWWFPNDDYLPRVHEDKTHGMILASLLQMWHYMQEYERAPQLLCNTLQLFSTKRKKTFRLRSEESCLKMGVICSPPRSETPGRRKRRKYL